MSDRTPTPPGPDFLDRLIARRTERNPEFPALLDQAQRLRESGDQLDQTDVSERDPGAPRCGKSESGEPETPV